MSEGKLVGYPEKRGEAAKAIKLLWYGARAREEI